MSKISELGPITGANTRSEDLLVIVNLVQGDDGTKNITRKELVEAIQYETFSRIKITGGTISGVVMSDSDINNVRIDDSDIEDTDIIRSTFDQGEITNSTADNVDITNSTFDDGEITDSTANNITITNSTFDDGEITDSTADNIDITNSTFDDGEITDSTADNVDITNSTFDAGSITNSTADNVDITNSTFANGDITDSTADNIDITNSTFDDGAITDSTADNIDITNSTASNVAITDSSFDDGTMDTVSGNNVSLINSTIDDSTFANGAISDSTANNLTITNSDFSDGTGNNNVFTNTTLDTATITDAIISNTSFTGTMDNVVAQNMTITSSSASNTGIARSTFDSGAVTQSTFDSGNITNSTFDSGNVTNSNLSNFEMDLDKTFDPFIDENSWFAIKNEKTGQTEKITYKQFFDELGRSASKAQKVHVAIDGNDNWPGSELQPVRTLERAFELVLEKAGGVYDRNALNQTCHISVGPGTFYTKGELKLPDDCSISSTSGQYATIIQLLSGYEKSNVILVGSGCYVQGFSFMNCVIDNFDYPEKGFAIAYRPGAKMLRSPYIRDCSQLSNFLREDVEPPLQPFNSKGTVYDLGHKVVLTSNTGVFSVDDEVMFSTGAIGYITRVDELATENTFYVRNLRGDVNPGDTVMTESGGTGTVDYLGEEDFPNKLVGRGGGVVLADRRVLDPDSLYTYVLCFGATPRTQNGMGYVARDGAGVNGIGSLSIFTRCAFYALNGGQMTLNNSGTQFGDISMRAKGSTSVYTPKETSATLLQNTVFADTVEGAADEIIDDLVEYLTSNTANGGLGYQAYDSIKCKRDTGIIIDNLKYDVSLDTNYWGRLSGITYRSPISYVVPGEQLEETAGAIRYLKGRVESIFSFANSEIIDRANTSFNELLNVLENGEENINPIIWSNTGNTAWTAARELIQENRDFIRNELIDWIENNDEFFAYNSKTCRRDTTEYILPAVKYDMLLDTNYNSVTAGNAYYMATAAKVVGEQKNETVSAYTRLKQQTNKLVDANSFVAATKVDESFDEIIDILNNGQSASDVITFSDSSSISADKRNARKQLQANKAYIQDLVLGYIDSNYFRYDSIKCKRDVVEYILPAIQRDLLLGTNFNSVQIGIGYYSATASEVVGTQLPETVAAVTELKQLVANNVLSDAESIERTDRAFGEIIDIMNNGLANVDIIFWSDPAKDLEYFTPTNVDYDPVTGVSIITIPSHSLQVGDHITIKPESLTFTCPPGAQEISHPRVTDPAYEMALTITAANTDTITVNVGDANGYANTHTFVSAKPESIAKVSITADNSNANRLLQANRTFLQEEVKAYLEDNYFAYNGATCSRDVGLILDSVRRDVATGSNFNSVFAGLAYRSGNASTEVVIDDQLPETVAAIQWVKGKIAAELSGGALARANTAFEEIIDIMQNGTANAAVISFGTSYVSTDTNTARVALQLNKEFLKAEVTAWITNNIPGLTYNSAKCERDVGYLIDSVSWDIQHGSNTASINNARLYYDNAVNVLPEDQKIPTARAFEHLASVAALIVLDEVVTPTSGNIETQDTSQSAVSLAVANQVKSLIELVATVIRQDSLDWLPTPDEPKVENTTYEEAVNEIIGLKAPLQDGVILYLREDWNGLDYNVEKCYRDVGLIIDAVTKDITYGGNENIVEAAKYYFTREIPFIRYDFNLDTETIVYNTLPESTRKATKAAFLRLASVAEDIVTGVTVTKSTNNGETQDTSGTYANSAIGASVSDLIEIIANIIDKDSVSTVPTSQLGPVYDDLPTFPTVVRARFNPNRTEARKQIQTNKAFIIEEVISYLNDRYFTFDGEKCSRDVGYLIDAVKRDVLTGSNFNSVFNGLAYRSGTAGANVVIEEQLSETVAALEYVRDNIVEAVEDSLAKTRTTNAFNEIIDIMSNGSSAADVINFGAQQLSINRLNGRVQLQNNKNFFKAEITAYIAVNYPSLVYDVAKCERDIGYLIDSVSFDIQHGGNTASINNARLYFENAVSVLPVDQRAPTAAAFSRLADVALLVAQDLDVTPSAGNTVPQDKSGVNATLAVATEIESLINIVTDAVQANSLSSLPASVEPTLSTYAANYQDAYAEIEAAKSSQQTAVITFLTQSYYALPYNEAKCRRDTGYIIDAISHDIQYGGNAATLNAAGIYFENAVNVLPINQRQATKEAFTHLGEVINMICREMEVTRSPGNTLTQSYTDVATNPLTGMAAQDLALIVANIVDDTSTANFPARVDPFVDWINSNFVTSKELIEDQVISLADSVLDYLSNQENALSFPADKCRRDIGYLVDAVSHDVQYDGNYATRIAAGIYFENGISVLPADTRTQTADVYAYLGTVLEGIVQEIDTQNTVYTDTTQNFSGTPATATEGARVNSLIGIVEDVIRNNTLEALPSLVQPNTAWVAADVIGAAQLIDDNTEALADDMINWLKEEFVVLDYNRDKCYRDTGYLLDAFSFDLNYGGNSASRWNADFYYWNNKYRIPEDQRIATAKSYRQLGRICADIVLGKYSGQVATSELATETEAEKAQYLADIFYKTQINNDTKYLPVLEDPDYSWVDKTFTDSQKVFINKKESLQKDVVRFVNAEYKFVDIILTRRDAKNLLKAFTNDFRFINTVTNETGSQRSFRTYTQGFFDYNAKHVFPVFNPSNPLLKYQGTVEVIGDLSSITNQKPYHAYIVATDYATSFFTGNIYYWNGSTWVLDGANNTDLLDAFVESWERIRDYIVTNYSPNVAHTNMINGLFDDVLIDGVLRPTSLKFGALVESIAHQFNGGAAGVNRNALPLNFRNLGLPISALASVLYEDGGRVRWSGSDELNNQYFARGLRINGRTGRIEGRPFTSSVRKLARRASNSRATV